MASGLEADAVDRGVDLRHPEELLDLVRDIPLGDVDGLAAEAAGLGQALGNEIAHDDHGRAQELGRVRTGQAHRPRPGDVDGRTGADAGGVGAVETGRKDVGEHGQVEDLLHRLIFVGELEKVPVGVGNHHVLGLPANPATHVHVAVGGTGALGVDVEADAGLALFAVPAAPAGDVEGHRAEVALLDVLDIAPDLDHLAGDLVAEDQALRRRGPTPDHVLVRAADVSGDDLQDDPVLALSADVLWVDAWAVLEHQLGIVDGLDLDFPRTHVGDRLVTRHEAPSSSRASAAPAGRDGRYARRTGAAPTPRHGDSRGLSLRRRCAQRDPSPNPDCAGRIAVSRRS